MKKIIKRIKNNPMLIVFFVILLLFAPAALFAPGESMDRAVVTAIGIDKQDDEYIISLLTFIPTPNQTYLETNSVVNGKGDNMAEALYNAELTLGRKLGLSHVKTAVVNEELLKEDISKDLSYLSHISALSENTVFICTNDKAQDFLNSAQSLEKDIGLKLEDLVDFNVTNIYVTDTTLEAFFKGYYSNTRSAIIGFLSLEENCGQVGCAQDKDDGGESTDENGEAEGETEGGKDGVGGASETGYSSSTPSSGGSGSSSGGQSGGTEEKGTGEKRILNLGEVILLKDGRKVAKLSTKQLQGINITNDRAIGRSITVAGVSNEFYNDATLTYVIRNKRVTTKTKFNNGIPIYSADIVLGLELVEGKENGRSIKSNTEISEIPHDVYLKIEEQIRQDYSDTLRLIRDHKTDVIGVMEKFERENKKNFRKFLDSLDDPDDYLNFIIFELIVDIQSD